MAVIKRSKAPRTWPIDAYCSNKMLVRGAGAGVLLVVVLTWYTFSSLSGATGDPDDPLELLLTAREEIVVRRPEKLFVNRSLVLLTISYHASPTQDLIDQLEPFGVRVIERGMNAYNCRYFGSCYQQEPLQVVDYERVHRSISSKNIADFYDAYANDSLWQSVDAFVCFYPIATCELLQMFNKSLILVTTTRYDVGRKLIPEWKRWNNRLLQFASNPINLIAASNQYDVEYMKYYTGLSPRLLPSRCSYGRTSYNPTRPGFLLGLREDWKFREFFLAKLNKACSALRLTAFLAPVRDLYPTYRWTDLAAHRGIVPLPTQPSTMRLLEQYRMNIPHFLPTKELLLDFQLSEMMMLNDIYSHYPGDTLPAHPSQKNVPDPTIRLATALRHWIKLCDWYTTLPHVILYSSMEDLAMKLNQTTDAELMEVSRRMKEHNSQASEELTNKWKEILLHVARHSPNKPH